jgi:hypothetical protein
MKALLVVLVIALVAFGIVVLVSPVSTSTASFSSPQITSPAPGSGDWMQTPHIACSVAPCDCSGGSC